MEKIDDDRQNIGKINQTMNYALQLEREKMWPQWMSNIPSKRMLKKMCWCKQFKKESSRHSICLVMRCSKEGRHLWTTRARGCQNQCELESLTKNKTKIMIRRH
jgi:hypothetical protein